MSDTFAACIPDHHSLWCDSSLRQVQVNTALHIAQEAEMLRPRVPALEAEVLRLQVDVQDRNKGLREAQNEESLARAQVRSPLDTLHSSNVHVK